MVMLSQWLADGNQPQRRILLLGESLATAYVRLSKVLWSLTPASRPYWSLQGCPTYRACPMRSAANSWANRLEANFGKQEVAHLWEQDAYATSRTNTRTAAIAYVGLPEAQCTSNSKTTDAAPALSAKPTVNTYPP
jgi:ABC-type branched-subunit amino acid transport system substrate-binding protein